MLFSQLMSNPRTKSMKMNHFDKVFFIYFREYISSLHNCELLSNLLKPLILSYFPFRVFLHSSFLKICFSIHRDYYDEVNFEQR